MGFDSSLGGGEADGSRPRAVLESRDVIRRRRYEIRHDNPRAARSPAWSRCSRRATADVGSADIAPLPLASRRKGAGARRTEEPGGKDSAGPIATRGDEPAGTVSSRRGTGAESVIDGGAGASSTGWVRRRLRRRRGRRRDRPAGRGRDDDGRHSHLRRAMDEQERPIALQGGQCANKLDQARNDGFCRRHCKVITIIDGMTSSSLSSHHDAGENNAVGGDVVSGDGVDVNLGSWTCPRGPADTVQTETVREMKRGKFLRPPSADGGIGAGGAPGAAAAAVVGTSSHEEAQLPKPLPTTAVGRRFTSSSRQNRGDDDNVGWTRKGDDEDRWRLASGRRMGMRRRDLNNGEGMDATGCFFLFLFLSAPLLAVIRKNGGGGGAARVRTLHHFIATGPAWTCCFAPAGYRRRRRPTRRPETRRFINGLDPTSSDPGRLCLSKSPSSLPERPDDSSRLPRQAQSL